MFGALSNAAYEESEDIARTERERPASFTDPDGTLEPVRTRADLDDAVDRGKRWNLLSGLSYGVAAVSLGASIYYFLGERSEERRGLPLPLAVVPSADGVQLVWDQELDF